MLDADAFILADGARLPYRAWLPEGRPEAVILALHGFNDSRNAWLLAAPVFVAAGFALYAPDQRGFGATEGRGRWPGADALAVDAAEMARLLRARHPDSKLVLMGESMGGAVLMHLATSGFAPADVSYVLLAPAVWGRARMNVLLRATLFVASVFVPGMYVSRPPPVVKIVASDNRDALIRLSNDPLTIKQTRVGTTAGLVDLMDIALAAGASFRAPALFLYGGHDDLVPKAATRQMWRALPEGPRRLAYYASGYHLMLCDLGRAAPLGDIISWIKAPGGALPSGAEGAVEGFLQEG